MRARLKDFAYRYLLADTIALSPAERWRSALGALLSMVMCGAFMHALPVDAHWLIAPIGASTVILFALSHSPLAQPWPVMGAYLFATLSGLAAAVLIPWPQFSAALAVAASVWLMARFNCFHPPSGALALFLVLDGPYPPERLGSTMALVFINMVVMLAAAFIVNNFILRRQYPYTSARAASLHATRDAVPIARIGLSHADLQAAVRSLDTFVDIKESELVRLYNLAVDNAFNRHVGLTCADIMARDVATVEFATELDTAWRMLRAHKVKALPVIDRISRRLIGIVTVADFLRQLDDTTAAGLAVRLQGLLMRTPGPSSEKAEVVGQIMSTNVAVAHPETLLSELVSALSDKGMHHFPVVDDKQRVVGMVTQSDLIAALYKRIALTTPSPSHDNPA